MYINSLLCILCLVIQAGISLSEKNAGQRTQAKPTYNFHNKPDQHHTTLKGIINIDDEMPQNDQVEGSGGRDDTESGGSGLGPDDEDGEGESGSGSGVSVSTFSRDTGKDYWGPSRQEPDPLGLDAEPKTTDNLSERVTNRELSNCEKLRAKAKNIDRDLIGGFLPICKSNGDFKEEQCDSRRGECWCVDRHGVEVKYTKKRMPNKPNCERDVDPSYQTSERDTKKKPTPEPETTPSETPEPEPEKGKGEEYTEENEDKAGNDDGTDLMTFNKGQAAASTAFMASPGILAGIIGGTIVGLLCAILLVLFIVYRMRKKDEGSYALDEPKHSPSMHSYQRAPAREFYA